MSSSIIQAFFEASHIAVIGASSQSNKITTPIVGNLLRSFKGRLSFVTPLEERIFTYPTIPNVEGLPENVDLAIIATPEEQIPEILESLGKQKIRNIILFTKLSERYQEIALKHISKYSLNLLGDNSTGILSHNPTLDTLHLPPDMTKRPPKGKVSIISNSRSLGYQFLDLAANHDLGIHKYIHLGTELGVTLSDAMMGILKDPETRALVLLLSAIKNPETLQRMADEAKKLEKQILLFALQEPTLQRVPCENLARPGFGPLKTEDIPSEIISYNSLDPLIDACKIVHLKPRITDTRTAILTNGMGPARYSLDLASRYNLPLAELTPSTMDKLRSTMPQGTITCNPIVLVAEATESNLMSLLHTVYQDPNTGIILFTLNPHLLLRDLDRLGILIAHVITNETLVKPLIMCTNEGENLQALQRHLTQDNVALFATPAKAIKAISSIMRSQ